MHLVEVFLPTGYPNGDLIPQSIFDLIEGELREKFDGVVVYARKSARTLSRSHARQMEESLLVIEIVTDDLDKEWWKEFRHRTQALFHHDDLLIRATITERL